MLIKVFPWRYRFSVDGAGQRNLVLPPRRNEHCNASGLQFDDFARDLDLPIADAGCLHPGGPDLPIFSSTCMCRGTGVRLTGRRSGRFGRRDSLDIGTLFAFRSHKSLIRSKRQSFWPESFVVYWPQISSWSSATGPWQSFKLTCNADFANFCQSGQSPFSNSELSERHCCSDFDDTFRYRTGGGLHSQGLCTEKVQAVPFGSRLFSSTLKTDCGFSSQQRMGTAGRCRSLRNYL